MFGILKNRKENKLIKELTDEISNLRCKLNEAQININKTNAYWKKKVYDLNRKAKL